MIAMQNQQMSMLGSVPQMAPVPGQSVYPPQFTYAPRQHDSFQVGLGLGGGMFNSAGPGAGGLAAAAGDVQFAGMLGGLGAGMLGMRGLSRGLGAVSNSTILGGITRLDPMNSMIMGGMGAIGTTYAAGAAGGAGIMGGLGALASAEGLGAVGAGMLGTAGLMNPIALAGMAASVPLKMMYQGSQQFSQTRQMLNSYNTAANPMSTTGRGFSNQQASDITTMMRGINAADPFTNFSDVTAVMQRFNEFGMNQGSRDVSDFSRKFKTMMTTVKDMAKTLGTTIEGATQMFGEMRSAGFYRGTDIVGNTNLLKMMQGQGVSGRMMLGAQMQGGGITRSAGLGTTPGAKAVGSMAGLLAGARMTGSISSEEMMNATGAATPEEALTQYSTQMAGGMTQFLTQSSTGAALTAALGSVNERGEFTGEMDEGLMAQMRSGSININNLVQSGRKRLTNRNSQLSFKTKGADVAGAMLGEDPTEAFGLIMKSVAGEKFSQMDPENLIALLTERMTGLDRKTAESMVKIVREGAKTRAETTAMMNREAQQKVYEIDVAQNRTISGLKTQFLGGLADKYVRPMEQVGQNLSVGIGEDYQRFVDSIPGLKVTRVGSDETLRQQALRSEYRDMDSATGGMRRSGLAISSALKRAGFSDEQSAAEQSAALSGKDMSAAAQEALTGGRADDELFQSFKSQIERGGIQSVIQEGGIDSLLSSGVSGYETYRGKEGMEVRSVTLGDYMGRSADNRAAISALLSKSGYTTASRRAAMGGRSTTADALEEMRDNATTSVSALLGDYSRADLGNFDFRDKGRSQTLMAQLEQNGGAGIVSQMSKSFDRDKFEAELTKATKIAGEGDEAFAEAMKALGAEGSVSQLASAGRFFKKTTGKTGKDYAGISKYYEGAQGGLDYLNISTAMSGALAGMTASAPGAEKFRALASEAEVAASGGSLVNYRQNLESFYQELEKTGTTGTELQKSYGAYGKDIQSNLALRANIRGQSTISGLKKATNFTDEDLKAMGIDMSDDVLTTGEDSEASRIAELATRSGTRSLRQSAGAILSGSTEETQVAIAAEYAKLAKSTDALAGTVLQIQHDQQAKGSATQTAVPAPDGGGSN